MVAHLKTLYSFRELLWMWTLRELKIRYKQTILGIAWALLQPLVLMVVFSVVFSFFARMPSDDVPYPIFSYTALLPWTFLATSISFAVPSLVNNMNLVTKIYFPREILPISTVIAAFIDFLLGAVIFLGLMIFYRLSLQLTVIWVPVLVAVQTALTLGIVLLLSALNVWYRDIRFIVPLGIQLWMYASPIIYPATVVPERLRVFYMLNPMAGLIDSYRRVLLQGQPPDTLYLMMSTVVTLILILMGYTYFKRSEALFADVI